LARWVGSHRTLGGFRWRYAATSWRGIWLLFHKYSSQLPIPCQMPVAPEPLSLFVAICRDRLSRGSEETCRWNAWKWARSGPELVDNLSFNRANPQTAGQAGVTAWRDNVSRRVAAIYHRHVKYTSRTANAQKYRRPEFKESRKGERGKLNAHLYSRICITVV